MFRPLICSGQRAPEETDGAHDALDSDRLVDDGASIRCGGHLGGRGGAIASSSGLLLPSPGLDFTPVQRKGRNQVEAMKGKDQGHKHEFR
jgi:hypothetical protein